MARRRRFGGWRGVAEGVGGKRRGSSDRRDLGYKLIRVITVVSHLLGIVAGLGTLPWREKRRGAGLQLVTRRGDLKCAGTKHRANLPPSLVSCYAGIPPTYHLLSTHLH